MCAETPKPEEFNLCPRCDSKNVSQTDYEDEKDDEDTEGRRCDDCGWEGDVSELVCAPDGEKEQP